jgi:hypothetical protein
MNLKKDNQATQKKADGSVLPFPPTPSASKAGYTLAESAHKRREELSRLPDDAPNVLIVLLDDAGFGLSDAVGGEVRTPAFSRIAKAGICNSPADASRLKCSKPNRFPRQVPVAPRVE